MDEILYGGGMSVPVRGSDGPDESNVVSDMFFVAPDSLLADAFESVVTKPMKLGEAPRNEVYIMVTFKGRLNNENRLGAVTVVMAPEMMLSLFTTLRKQYGNIPINLRTSD